MRRLSYVPSLRYAVALHSHECAFSKSLSQHPNICAVMSGLSRGHYCTSTLALKHWGQRSCNDTRASAPSHQRFCFGAIPSTPPSATSHQRFCINALVSASLLHNLFSASPRKYCTVGAIASAVSYQPPHISTPHQRPPISAIQQCHPTSVIAWSPMYQLLCISFFTSAPLRQRFCDGAFNLVPRFSNLPSVFTRHRIRTRMCLL